MKDNTGILILGCPRSGTTLLRRLLGTHPNIACPGETGLFRACAAFLNQETSGVGVEIGVLPGLGYAGFETSDIILKLRKFAFAFMEDFADREGKPRWLEKDAFNSFHIRRIEQLCEEEIKYICIVRHGLDVAPSIQELCNKSESAILDIHQYLIQYKRPMEAFTKLWVDVNSEIKALQERRPQQTILIKYEDLVSKPEIVIGKILEFLDEPIPDDLISKASNSVGHVGLGDWKTYSREEIDSTSVHRWQSLHPYLIARMAGIANPTLKSLGYDEVNSEWDDNPEIAKRRYELALRLNAMKPK